MHSRMRFATVGSVIAAMIRIEWPQSHRRASTPNIRFNCIELPAESTAGEAKQAAAGTEPSRSEQSPSEPSPSEQQPSGEGPLVLVIDDEDTARDLLTRTLLKQDFSVCSAASGKEGLRLAKDLQPVAITLDVMMPGLDGWAVLRQLKSDPDTADIPVVMVTILRDEQLGFALGASEYLTKPVDRERLLEVIASCATGDSRSALVVDDDPDARAILTRQLERESWSVREAENGRVALERLAEDASSSARAGAFARRRMVAWRSSDSPKKARASSCWTS